MPRRGTFFSGKFKIDGQLTEEQLHDIQVFLEIDHSGDHCVDGSPMDSYCVWRIAETRRGTKEYHVEWNPEFESIELKEAMEWLRQLITMFFKPHGIKLNGSVTWHSFEEPESGIIIADGWEVSEEGIESLSAIAMDYLEKRKKYRQIDDNEPLIYLQPQFWKYTDLCKSLLREMKEKFGKELELYIYHFKKTKICNETKECVFNICETRKWMLVFHNEEFTLYRFDDRSYIRDMSTDEIPDPLWLKQDNWSIVDPESFPRMYAAIEEIRNGKPDNVGNNNQSDNNKDGN